MLENRDCLQEGRHRGSIHILLPFWNRNSIALTGITIFRLVIRRESKEGTVSLAPSSNLCKWYRCPSPDSAQWGHKRDSRVENNDLQPWLPFRINLGAFSASLFPGPDPLLIQLNLNFAGWGLKSWVQFLNSSQKILTGGQDWEALTQGTQNTELKTVWEQAKHLSTPRIQHSPEAVESASGATF